MIGRMRNALDKAIKHDADQVLIVSLGKSPSASSMASKCWAARGSSGCPRRPWSEESEVCSGGVGCSSLEQARAVRW